MQWNEDETWVLSNILSSKDCAVEGLFIKGWHFVDGSDRLFADALAQNQSLKTVSFIDTFSDNSFADEIIAALPQCTFLKHVSFRLDDFGPCDDSNLDFVTRTLNQRNEGKPTDAVNLDIDRLIRNVAQAGNCSITELYFDKRFRLPAQEIQNLERDLEQNYTLERITLTGGQPYRPIGFSLHAPVDELLARPILTLNSAGRRYLFDDSISTSKCIDVLAKVKYDLDCLFYHLRENPILCKSFVDVASNDVHRKHKVTDIP